MVAYLHTFQEGMLRVCPISQTSPLCKKIWIHHNGKSRPFPNPLKRRRQLWMKTPVAILLISGFGVSDINTFGGEEKITQKLQQYLSDVIVQIFKMQLQLHQDQENALQHRKLVFYLASSCWWHRRFGFVDQTALKQLAD